MHSGVMGPFCAVSYTDSLVGRHAWPSHPGHVYQRAELLQALLQRHRAFCSSLACGCRRSAQAVQRQRRQVKPRQLGSVELGLLGAFRRRRPQQLRVQSRRGPGRLQTSFLMLLGESMHYLAACISMNPMRHG